jgi:PAS domain S-box-containing protein
MKGSSDGPPRPAGRTGSSPASRVQAFSNAEEERFRLAAIVDSSEDAIISKNLDGIVTSWNAGAERLFGYTASEIIGQPVSRLMPPEHSNDMVDILGKISPRREGRAFRDRARLTKSGKMIPISLSVSPIRDGTGRIIGAAKIARDISEQKANQAERERLLREAEEAARAREEFLSVAGHEMRTPLTSLEFLLHTIQKRIEIGQTEKAVEGLARARAQLGRLSGLTNDLLDSTRITAGRLTLEPEEIELGELAREMADHQRESAARTGSEIRFEAPFPVTGLWDPSRLEQVVTNLLSNAVKFGGGKPITVRVEADEDRAKLTVRDGESGLRSRINPGFSNASSAPSRNTPTEDWASASGSRTRSWPRRRTGPRREPSWPGLHVYRRAARAAGERMA